MPNRSQYIQQPAIQCSAIILHTHPFSDSDTIARVLTPELGKLGLISKRARDQNKKQCQIEIFDIGDLELSAGRGDLFKLKRFVLRHPFKKIRSDIDRLNIASTTCEAFDLLIKEGQNSAISLYDALSLALQAIDAAPDNKTALKACYIALNHLMNTSGFSAENLAAQASLKGLNKLLDQIEFCSERGLNSRAMLEMTLAGLVDNK